MDPMRLAFPTYTLQEQHILREVDSLQILELHLLVQNHQVRTTVDRLGVIEDLEAFRGTQNLHLDKV